MIAPSLQTLFRPLESGDVPATGPALFLNADWHPFLPQIPDLTVSQAFKPVAERLEHHGVKAVTALPPEELYALVIVHLPKQVEEAKYLLATACDRLAPDGWLVAGAANDANGNRLVKWLDELGLKPASLSKNKARTVWARQSESRTDVIKLWISEGLARQVDLGDGIVFKSQPGLFSWNRVDEGSRLLAAHLPGDLKGTGADFGAGIGYLSYRVLTGDHRLTGWHVLEADMRALDCARENLAGVRDKMTLNFGWVDLTKPVPALPPLDVIVMNPPFHDGKTTEASVGQGFIRTAAHHLKKGGRLFMVANTHLPYEAILNEVFKSHRPLAQDRGFKVIEAVK